MHAFSGGSVESETETDKQTAALAGFRSENQTSPDLASLRGSVPQFQAKKPSKERKNSPIASCCLSIRALRAAHQPTLLCLQPALLVV
jgi:hypothetical protein